MLLLQIGDNPVEVVVETGGQGIANLANLFSWRHQPIQIKRLRGEGEAAGMDGIVSEGLRLPPGLIANLSVAKINK